MTEKQTLGQKIAELRKAKNMTQLELAVKLKEVLTSLSEEDRLLLEYKYFKRKPKEYFKDFDSNSRAYFRRQNALVKTLSTSFEMVGITDEWFKLNCLKMDFFIELFRRVKTYEEQSNKNKPKQASNQSAIKRYKQFSAPEYELRKQADIA